MNTISVTPQSIVVYAFLILFVFTTAFVLCGGLPMLGTLSRKSIEEKYWNMVSSGYLKSVRLNQYECLILEGAYSLFSTVLPFDPTIISTFMSPEDYLYCVHTINEAVMEAECGLPKYYNPCQVIARNDLLFAAASAAAYRLTEQHPGLRFTMEDAGWKKKATLEYEYNNNGNRPTQQYDSESRNGWSLSTYKCDNLIIAHVYASKI